MCIYVVLICCQMLQALLGILVIDTYSDPREQVLETIQASLFFLLVDSIWYRMKALRAGDRYFV